MVMRSVFAAFALLALTGCDEGSGGFGTSFQERYFVAREALDNGRYQVAVRHYGKLANAYPDSPIAIRLRLEMAHAQLRSGQYQDAATTARGISTVQTGQLKGMALAVLGTAEHELGRVALTKDRLAAGGHLRAADAALKEMLRRHPKLDEGGAMARRHKLLRAELASLG